MKYLIENKIINSDHIVEVRYLPETPLASDPLDRESLCTIETVNDAPSFEYITRLRGKKADAFWQVYSADSIDVLKVEA